MIFAGIFSLMIVATVIFRYNYRKRKAHKFLTSIVDKETGDKTSVLLYSMNFCCKTLGDVISTIISGDKIQICQKHRLFVAEYDKFEYFTRHAKEVAVRDDTYLQYVWDATLKTIESGRKMVVHPEFNPNATEIIDLGFWTSDFPKGEFMKLSEIGENSRLNKEKVSGIIRNFSNSMSHKDYEEGSQKYSFLLFLYYLHSFMMSLDNLANSYKSA